MIKLKHDDDEKTARVNQKWQPELELEAKAAAKKNGISFSQFTRHAVRKLLKTRSK